MVEDFSQDLTRVDRRLSAKARVWQWVCPGADDTKGCGELAYKLYLPLPVWTISAWLGDADALYEAETGKAWARGFVCRRCARLLYESSEWSSSPGVGKDGLRRRVDVWDRFVKRISGGVVGGSEVEAIAEEDGEEGDEGRE